MPQRSVLDKTFDVSILLKGLDGVLEVIGGVLLLVTPVSTVNHLVTFLTQHELSRDPHDFMASHLVAAAHHLTSSTALLGFLYLASHGLVKIVLVVALLKNKLWAYPWTMAFLTLFVGYQLYRLTGKPTIGLSLLTIFDVFVIILTWLEYQKHRSALA